MPGALVQSILLHRSIEGRAFGQIGGTNGALYFLNNLCRLSET